MNCNAPAGLLSLYFIEIDRTSHCSMRSIMKSIPEPFIVNLSPTASSDYLADDSSIMALFCFSGSRGFALMYRRGSRHSLQGEQNSHVLSRFVGYMRLSDFSELRSLKHRGMIGVLFIIGTLCFLLAYKQGKIIQKRNFSHLRILMSSQNNMTDGLLSKTMRGDLKECCTMRYKDIWVLALDIQSAER